MQVIEGHLDAQGLQFALVVSRFNEALTSRLESGAVDCLIRHGAEDGKITIVRVPGAWEIPMVAARLAGDGGFDAVICVGALVRGGTAHFDLLAAEVAKGVAQAAISSGVPMTGKQGLGGGSGRHRDGTTVREAEPEVVGGHTSARPGTGAASPLSVRVDRRIAGGDAGRL